MSWALLENSLLFAGLATLIALAAGLVTALFLFASGPRLRFAGIGLAVVALALPPFLVANCWLDVLGQTGRWRAWLPVNLFDLRSAAIIMGLMLWPIPLFAALAAWLRLGSDHLEVEPLLTGGRLLRRLLLPAAWPALSTAGALVFILALANFSIPSIFQVKVFTAEVWLRFSTNYDHRGALVASLPVVVIPVLAWLWLRRREVSWPREQDPATPALVRRRLGWRWLGLIGAVAVVVGFLSVILPLTELVSNRRTWAALAPALAAGGGAVWHSGWLAGLTATLVMATGLGCWRWRSGAVLWLAFLFPGVFLGLVLIWVLNRPGLTLLYSSAAVLVVAMTVRYLGAGWQAARLACQVVDAELIDAARLAGGSRWQVWRLAVWPQVRAPLLAGWYVVYLLCLWDIETLVLITPPGVETLSLRIFNLLHYGHNPQVNAFCLALLGLALLPLVVWAVVERIPTRRWHRSNLESGRRRPRSRRRPDPSGLAAADVAVRASDSLGWRRGLVGLAAALTLAGCGRSPGDGGLADSRFFERAEAWGTRGRGAGQFNKPRSLAVDARDNLYVVDMTGRVQKFNRHGDFLLFWQMPETDLGRAKGMALDQEGRVIVIEPHYSRVNHFSTDGQLARQWGEHGTNRGQLVMPRAAAVNARGEIWLCEYGATERIQRFSKDGQHLLASLGSFGSGPGQFNRAEGLCVDAEGRLYVADSCNHRIQVFDPEGRWLRSHGRAGAGQGELSYPYDIRVDEAGNQYVCEFGNSRIQLFDAQDRPVETLGGPGAAPGQFSNPWSIAFDSAGNLYVADAGNHRVQKLVRRPSRDRQTTAPRTARRGFRRSETGDRRPEIGDQMPAVRLAILHSTARSTTH